jgi:hypothetical protein
MNRIVDAAMVRRKAAQQRTQHILPIVQRCRNGIVPCVRMFSQQAAYHERYVLVSIHLLDYLGDKDTIFGAFIQLFLKDAGH